MQKANVSVPIKINELPGELIVYPQYYIDWTSDGNFIADIPDTLRTVQELRDEIESYPENKRILQNIVKYMQAISRNQKSGYFNKEDTIEEIYNCLNIKSTFNEVALFKHKKKKAKMGADSHY